jgi:hypothetical protein
MPTRAKQKVRTYHATMLVTRAEEWCVDAASRKEAMALLASGQGHRCHLGEVLDVALERMLDEQ